MNPLTFDVEILRVALSVALAVGRHARVEPGVGAVHLLKHERLVADQNPAGNVFHHEFALER